MPQFLNVLLEMNLDSATSTALVFAIPLLLLVIAVIGPFKQRKVFLILGVLLFLAGALLLIVLCGISGIAAGHGSGGYGGWDDGGPLSLWCGVCFSLLFLGFLIRPKNDEILDDEEEPELDDEW